MKSLSYIISAFFVLISVFTTNAAAQPAGDQTITFKVYGVCDDCKQRIELAAMDAKGVKKAEWDKQSNVLVVVGSSKMTKEGVAAKVAKAGYKSDVCEADPEGYSKLPGCCQYKSDADKH
jgi:hypothetical protein